MVNPESAQFELEPGTKRFHGSGVFTPEAEITAEA